MKIVLFFCFSVFSVCSYADNTTITGNSAVSPGATETYSVVWESWDNTFQNYANVSWNVTGGTILGSDKSSVTIQWNSSLVGYLDGSGIIEVAEDLGGQNAQTTVTIVNSVQSSSSFCSGILGPAKVFVDFGNGNNPGPALTSGTTTYQYSTSCGLNVGEYTITNNSNSCRSLWHSVASDHTGNSNGYFLMINASSNRNEIYRTTVTGLTTSFEYEFSAWVGNLYNTSGAQDPVIRFEIYDLSGTLLASSGTITIPPTLPSFQWQRIGFMFNLPQAVTSVQVVMTNARGTTNNEGNDLVVDDISFAPCYPGIIASYSNSSIVDKAHTCNSGNVNLHASWPSNIPFSSPSYQWQRSVDNAASWSNISGATSLSYSHSENNPGIYQYRMLTYETSNPSQSITSNSLVYYVQTMVVDAHITNFYTCNGADASGTLPGFYHFLYTDPADAATLSYTFAWSPGTYLSNPNSLPTYVNLPGATPPSGNTPATPTTYNYTLTVTNSQYGCSASNTQTAVVLNPRKVGVPNAFTPGLSTNNVFVPINIEDYPGATFSVWNRWGTRVFYSEGPTKASYSWDGTYQGVPQPQEVYVWGVYLPGCPTNIFSGSGGDGVNRGDVTLLR